MNRTECGNLSTTTCNKSTEYNILQQVPGHRGALVLLRFLSVPWVRQFLEYQQVREIHQVPTYRRLAADYTQRNDVLSVPLVPWVLGYPSFQEVRAVLGYQEVQQVQAVRYLHGLPVLSTLQS